jgi:hypothetical protein
MVRILAILFALAASAVFSGCGEPDCGDPDTYSPRASYDGPDCSDLEAGGNIPYLYCKKGDSCKHDQINGNCCFD